MRFLRKAVLLLMAALLWFVQTGCEDYYRPVANPIISPGGQPQTAHYAWVVNYNPAGPGTTTEIDVSGDSNLAVTSMGNGSIAEAFPPSTLALFVANRDNDTVSEYLPTLAGAVTTISLLTGSHPVYLASGQTANMYVVNSGSNSTCPNTGSVSTIPVATLSVSTTTCVGRNPTMAVQSPSNVNLYVLNQADATISVINGTTGGTINFPSGQTPVYMAVSSDGNWIFVVTQDGSNSGTLYLISAGATALATCNSSPCAAPLGVMPNYAVADPTLNRLYVTNGGDDTVSVFDTSNVTTSSNPPLPLLATVTVGMNPIGVTPLISGTLFYVANAGSNTVSVVSANSFSTQTTVSLPAGASPVFIASDPTSSKVYVADQGISATTIIQTSNNTISGSVSAPQQQSSCTSSCPLQTPKMIVSR